jgi:septal ring factor EnvC (AmiA/AmiB activator)
LVKRLITGGLALAGLCLAAPPPPAGAATHPAQAPALAPAAPVNPDILVGQLDTAVQQGVATARAVQKDEATIGAAARDLAGEDRDLAAKQRALDMTRARAAGLLAALERFVHTPRAAALLEPQSPVDRLRSGMLMAAAVPALSGEAHALIGELQRLSTLRTQTLAKQDSLARDRQDLGTGRARLDQLSARREELRRQILHEIADSDPRAVKQGSVAVDLPDLIARGDGEAELRDREMRARAARTKGAPATDPTHPKTLHSFDKNAALTVPVAGAVTQRFGQSNELGTPSQGMTLAAVGNAEVVAPFDGQVDYIGPFRGYGTILIIDHGGGYHSVLAGLGRVDAKIGEWVVAGEPVGTLADAAKADDGVTLYFELRHDGQAVDPQLSLTVQAGQARDHRVNE